MTTGNKWMPFYSFFSSVIVVLHVLQLLNLLCYTEVTYAIYVDGKVPASNALSFFRVLGKLKGLKRTGWVNHGKFTLIL